MAQIDGNRNGIPQVNIPGVQPKVVAPAGIQPKEAQVANLSTGTAGSTITAQSPSDAKLLAALNTKYKTSFETLDAFRQGYQGKIFDDKNTKDIQSTLNGYDRAEDKDSFVSDYEANLGANPTETGSGTPAATPTYGSTPASYPEIPQMPASQQLDPEKMEAAQKLVDKVGADGNVTLEGKNKDNAKDAKDILEATKSAKEALETNYNNKINESAQKYSETFTKVKTDKINKEFGVLITDPEKLKDLIEGNAQGSIQKLQAQKAKAIYDAYGKDDNAVSDKYGYAENFLNKEDNIDNYNTVKNNLTQAIAGAKANPPTEKISDIRSAAKFAGSAIGDVKLLRKGLLDEKDARIARAKDNLGETAVTSDLEPKIAAAEAQLQELEALNKQLVGDDGKSGVLKDLIDRKNDELGKITGKKDGKDEAVVRDTEIKDLIKKRDDQISGIPKEVTEFQTKVKDGKFDELAVPEEFKDNTELAGFVTEIKETAAKKTADLEKMEKSIKSQEAQVAGLEAKAKVNPEGTSKEKIQTNFGDTLGNITQALTGLAGLALIIKGIDVASKAGNAGTPGLLGNTSTMPKIVNPNDLLPKYQTNADPNNLKDAIMAQAQSTKNYAFPGGAAANLSAAKSNVFPSQPNAT